MNLCTEHTTNESLLLKCNLSQELRLTSPYWSLTEIIITKNKLCILKALVLTLQISVNLVILIRQIPPKHAMGLKIIDHASIINIIGNF